ncbi:MAG: S9 family peptidase, partial [Muribaculaceae bacterium]|nr:S9 family peptidase [Muribaculaceae bacterium]
MKSIAIAIMTITALPAIAANPLSYPKAPKADVVDTYFGIEVADPYRPLENDTAANTLQWVEEQRALTSDYFSKIPFRDRLAREIAGFQNYRKTGLPFYGNDNRIYFYENDGLKNQAVLYRRDSIGAPAQVFLDLNTLSTDGTVALTGIYMSPSGRYTAYT